MATLKAISLATAAVIGTGGIGTTGAYIATSTTIGEHLKDDLLDQNSAEDWKELQKKLNKYTSVEKYASLGLKDIQKTETEDPSTGDDIKNWCKNQYETKINPSFFFFPWNNKDLFNAVETFCIRLIEEKLGSQKLELDKEETVKDTLKAKFESIKSHNSGTNGKLDDELEVIKTKDKEEGWKDLRDWCKRNYKKGYQKDSDLWKLVQHYCKSG